MKINKTIIILLLLIIGSIHIKAQEKELQYPEVGKPCPDFNLTDVQHYSKKALSVKDLKGQYVIFDFWGKTCMVCIQSFPHTNQIQKQFKDSLKIILVGYADKENQIKPMYEKLRIKNQLQLIAAFDSTSMLKLIPPQQGVPHLIWVNKDGIVKAITSSYDLTDINVKKFIRDENFTFQDMSFKGMQQQKIDYDFKKPFLVNGNGGNDTAFTYRTLLTEWKPGMSANFLGNIDIYLEIFKKPRYEILKAPLKVLFNLAYLGVGQPDYSFYSSPILMVKDSSIFNYTQGGDAKNQFCYSVTLPYRNGSSGKDNKGKLMQVMQGDLKNYFGYEATIEIRELPCLVLTVIDNKKIGDLQKKKNRVIQWGHAQGGKFQDIPIDDVCRIMAHDLPNDPRIINETHLKENINLELKILSTDLLSLRKGLNANGLDLVPSKRQMKVLVIRDVI